MKKESRATHTVDNPASPLRGQRFKDSKASSDQVLEVQDCGTKADTDPERSSAKSHQYVTSLTSPSRKRKIGA